MLEGHLIRWLTLVFVAWGVLRRLGLEDWKQNRNGHDRERALQSSWLGTVPYFSVALLLVEMRQKLFHANRAGYLPVGGAKNLEDWDWTATRYFLRIQVPGQELAPGRSDGYSQLGDVGDAFDELNDLEPGLSGIDP